MHLEPRCETILSSTDALTSGIRRSSTTICPSADGKDVEELNVAATDPSRYHLGKRSRENENGRSAFAPRPSEFGTEIRTYRRANFLRPKTPRPIRADPRRAMLAGSGAPLNGVGGVDNVPDPLMLLSGADCVNCKVKLAAPVSQGWTPPAAL